MSEFLILVVSDRVETHIRTAYHIPHNTPQSKAAIVNSDIEIAILGTLRVTYQGEEIDAPGGRVDRAVLGCLVLQANHVVPVSTIQRTLWRDRPPSTSRKMIQNSVSRLRKMISQHSSGKREIALVTQSPGYRLEIENAAVDLFVFRDLARSAQSRMANGESAVAREILRRALSLWYGRALADLVEEGFASSQLSAVEDERLTVLEDYFEAELACGRCREITPQLEIATEQAPLRERLRKQHMIALYRSGRQADALGIYRSLRQSLIAELGIEPGPELQKHYRMILAHDPALLRTESGPPRVIAAS